jgi:IS605 OrfB family transposase
VTDSKPDWFIRTLRLKVKKESYPWLRAAATEVNQVRNWGNQVSMDAADRCRRSQPRYLSAFDLNNLSAGACEYFEHIGADTIQRVNGEYVARRRAAKRVRLRWRRSSGPRRSLGWVPFKAASLRRKGTRVRFCSKTFRVFESYRLGQAQWGDGCFAQDAVGEWWLCLPVFVEGEKAPPAKSAAGIDLGCKEAAVSSDNERLESCCYRRLEGKIAQAQRRGHQRQAKRLHRRAANQRHDALHKFSTLLVRRYGQIFIGNVSAPKLARTRMAKSVLDAAWGMLRTQLEYKCQQAAREFQVVDERYTTQVCGNCGARTGPAGVGQLVVRQWECAACGVVHDRDVNAARNILTAGLRCRASVRGNQLPSLSARRATHPRQYEAGISAQRRTA